MTDDKAHLGNYRLIYEVASTMYPDRNQKLEFDVEIGIQECSKIWRFPPSALSFDNVYVRGAEALEIQFKGVDVNNCGFSLALFNITNDQAEPIDRSIGTLVQPKVVKDPFFDTIYSV